MKHVIVAVALAFAAAPAFAASMFSITMDAAQEVGTGSTSPSTATGSATLSRVGGLYKLDYAIQFDAVHDFGPVLSGGAQTGSDVTLLHIHNAPRGVNGGVVYGIIGPDTDADNDVTFTPNMGGTLLQGQWDAPSDNNSAFDLASLLSLTMAEDAPLYFNLHTVAFPAGAIRGQIVATNSATTPVPLPAAAPLLLAGLAATALVARRRRA